jgi:hypothetical protein
MPKTSRSAWKARERQAAGLFGAKRNRCSGSSGRPDCSRSDSTHDRLFIETKLRPSHAAVTLLDETRELARREGETPVVALATKGRPGVVLVLRAEDLPIVAAEYEAAKATPPGGS